METQPNDEVGAAFGLRVHTESPSRRRDLILTSEGVSLSVPKVEAEGCSMLLVKYVAPQLVVEAVVGGL